MEPNKCMCAMCSHKCAGKIAMAIVIIISLFVVVKIVKDMKEFKYIGDNAVRNSITVAGKGELMVKPDVANISFSITAEDMDVSKASDVVNKKIAEVVANLKANGVSEKDIKTTDYNIYPRYDYLKDTSMYYSGKQVLAAYVVTQGIELKIRDLSKTGKIITELGKLKVTNMSGLTFTNDKYDDLVKQARETAIVQARAEAKKLAKSLDVDLGEIISFSDNNNSPTYYARDMMKVSAAGMAPQEAVIPTGENKIVSNVSITYEIK
jgi:uncharacterized protein YggE